MVHCAHPPGVAFGQVVVDCNYVCAFAGDGIEIGRQSCDKGFAFPGAHFRNLALVKDDSPEKLNVEMTHSNRALRGLADHCKRLGEQVVEPFTVLVPRP